MAGVTFKLTKCDVDKKAKDALEKSKRHILYAMASSLYSHSKNYTPYLTHTLQNSAYQFQAGWQEGVITWGVHGSSYNYAARQYYDESLHHPRGGQARWAAVAEGRFHKDIAAAGEQAKREALR